MSDPFELQKPEDAEEFLGSFDPKTRRKGEAYFGEDRVSDLVCKKEGTRYSATVRGSAPYDVDLFYDSDEGWSGVCSCPLEGDCKHIYAAMKALLAEHSIARVRGLSAGGKVQSLAGARKKLEKPPEGPWAERVVTALDRKLRPDESKFLRKLTEVYNRCRQARHITRWDFDELGLRIGGYGWEALQIWPAFPESEHEFWLYVANAAMERQIPVPDFLASATDLSVIQERLVRWRRDREVARWNNLLDNLHGWEASYESTSRGEFDLRLRVDEKEAILEWKRPGQETFELLKTNPFRQFADDHRAGRVALQPEAEMIWQAFQARLDYGRSLQLSYHDSDALERLGRLFRLRVLDSRIVNSDGQPFARPAEALRWELAPAASEQGDYCLRLVQANGSVPAAFLVTLSGHPALYVTRDAVFAGPPAPDNVLDPMRENVIPAPAIESRAGIEFLQKLRIELPPRLRERVHHVAMQVVVSCELVPSYPGSSTEHCFVRVIAEAADGKVQEVWNGSFWHDSTSAISRGFESKDKAGLFTVYDRSALQEMSRMLEPLGLKWDNYESCFFLRVTKKFPALFVAWLKSLPPHIRLQLAGELASLAQDAVSGKVRLDVTEAAIDWFDLRVVIDVSDTTLTPQELKLLLDAKGGYVRLGKKGWRRLQFNLSEEEDDRLARLGLNPHELTSEPQRLHALQLADEAAKRFLPEQQAAQIQRRASEIKARVTPELPAGVKAELRPYQRDGFHFLAYLAANNFGGILADDMGLGKTLQTLTWLLWLRELNGTGATPEAEANRNCQQVPSAENGMGSESSRITDPHSRGGLENPRPEGGGETPALRCRPSLVVCPKSVMDNWRAEAERFTPELRVKLWSASELGTLLQRLTEADLHVINYSQLRIIGESLAPAQWLALILDEGQYIKNPASQTAQIARALRADYRLVLSGTPIENRLLDLWSLMAFAMPGVLGSRMQFAKMFDAKEDPFARRRLAARVRPFLLRRTKSQVAKDLPDRTEEDLFCEIEGEQKLLYRAELKRAQQMLLRIKTQKQLAKERFHFLTSLLRLRQICCHPALVKPESKAESAKLGALLELLEPLMDEGHKVLVFSQFVEMLGLLKRALADKGWPQFYLAGDTENRGALVQNFQSAEGAAVFLISLKAGGFGLNLTAASYVVLFDPWWNPAVENQAIDRTHRIGQ
ncbi:MAG: DEAD/DEAH box helicase, partial [Verrucomicrobiota bacterium]